MAVSDEVERAGADVTSVKRSSDEAALVAGARAGNASCDEIQNARQQPCTFQCRATPRLRRFVEADGMFTISGVAP